MNLLYTSSPVKGHSVQCSWCLQCVSTRDMLQFGCILTCLHHNLSGRTTKAAPNVPSVFDKNKASQISVNGAAAVCNSLLYLSTLLFSLSLYNEYSHTLDFVSTCSKGSTKFCSADFEVCSFRYGKPFSSHGRPSMLLFHGES